MGGSLYIPRVIHAGFDTIEGTFSGRVFPDAVGLLDDLKGAAQAIDQAVPFPLIDAALQPQGLRPYAWVLVGSDYHLRLGRLRDAAAGFRMLSVGLASKGAESLLASIKSDLKCLADLAGGRLSRVDVYCDLQGWDPDHDQMRHMICASGFRPVYPSVDAPETFQFGKGLIVARIYNKTREQAVKGGHWQEVWKNCEGYSSTEDVWRVEFQFRREALVQFGFADLGAIERGPRELFVAGLSWASLRSPTRDSNRRRWPLHPVWEFLNDRYAWSDPVRSASITAPLVRVDRLIPQLVGLLASCGAGLGAPDLGQTISDLWPRIEKYEMESGRSFADRVLDRQIAIYGHTFSYDHKM